MQDPQSSSANPLPLHFPGFGFLPKVDRPCGKKNCSAQLTLLGIPATMHFGGSGDPDMPPLDSLKPGDEVEWKYNNMIGRIPLIGWIVARLDRTRRSYARLDTRSIGGQTVLTVVYVQLSLQFEVPRLGLAFPMTTPFEFELDQILGPDHFTFRQVGSASALTFFGLKAAETRSSGLDVTSPRGGSIANVLASSTGLTFDFEPDPGFLPLSGPLVWFAHDPDNPSAPVSLGQVDLSRRTISVRRPAASPQTLHHGVQIEVVSLRDPSHLWAIHRI